MKHFTPSTLLFTTNKLRAIHEKWIYYFHGCDGLLLCCQTLTSPQRRRTDVHPECFPPAPKCCTLMAKDGGETCLPTNKTSFQQAKARSTFMKNNLSACSAFTGYVAASDARRTQPLLKLLGIFRHPGAPQDDILPARTTAHKLTDTRQAASRHTRAETKRGNVREPSSARLTCCSCASGQDGALSSPASVIILTSETSPSI